MKEIPLTRGYVALVDDEDYERVSQFKWSAMEAHAKHHTRVYAVRRTGSKKHRATIYMHRFVFQCSGPVDHRDLDGLNNRRENLREGSKSKNAANIRKYKGKTSRFKGVSLDKRTNLSKRWRAYIYQGKSINLGSCNDEVDAATVYNLAAYERFGEFARFNTPED